MDPVVATITVIAGIVGIIAGAVAIYKFIEERREKKAVATSSHVSDPPQKKIGANVREPSKLETEFKLQEQREKAKEDAQPADLSEISLALAELYRNKSELEKSEYYYQAAKAYYLSVGDKDKLGRTMVGLATIYTAKGKHSAAIAIAKEIETITNNPTTLAEAKLRLGICCRRTGEYSEALKYLNQSFETWLSLGDKTLAGETLVARGDVYRKLHNWTEAELSFTQSAEILNSELLVNSNDERTQIHLAQAKYALGRIYIEREKYEEAEKLLSDAFQSLERIGNFYGIEMCSQLMGRLYKARKEWGEARRWYHESFVATAITRNDLRRIETLFHMAELAYLTGDSIRAQVLASTSTSDARDLSFQNQLARLFTLLGHISSDASLSSEATNSYKEAILAALRASPIMVDEIFSRLTEKISAMSDKGNKKGAEYVVRDLIEWWPKARIDGKKAEQVENEQMPVKMGLQEKPKRVSSHLLDLLDTISK